MSSPLVSRRLRVRALEAAVTPLGWLFRARRAGDGTSVRRLRELSGPETIAVTTSLDPVPPDWPGLLARADGHVLAAGYVEGTRRG